MADKLSPITYGAAVAKAKKIISEYPVPFKYKGNVESIDDLPSTADVGDLYIVVEEQKKYVWDGTEWQVYGTAEFGGTKYIEYDVNTYDEVLGWYSDGLNIVCLKETDTGIQLFDFVENKNDVLIFSNVSESRVVSYVFLNSEGWTATSPITLASTSQLPVAITNAEIDELF